MLKLFATAPKGIEPILAQELTQLGAAAVHESRGGVAFEGTLAVAYRACLWSRTANRILLPLARCAAATAEELYAGVHALPWQEHLGLEQTLAVDSNVNASQLTHSQFVAQKVKDAIVDRLRDCYGRRPSVDRARPDVLINAYLLRDELTISLDLSGDSLHRRGYREATVVAPLKENLAAALLLKADWLAIAAGGGPLFDPLCGSGTLPIEAVLIAGNGAPGLLREHWGFLHWRQHQPALWEELLTEARERRQAGLARVPLIVGCDRDPRAVRSAQANATRAGVARQVRFDCRELARAEPPPGVGLIMVNPPYGERLGEADELAALYAQLGDWLKARCQGWQAAVFTGNPELGKRMGLKAHKVNAFYNGDLPCKLLRFSVEPRYAVDREAIDARTQQAALATALAEGADAFANRLRKNLQHLGRWARREGIRCYRLYDADIPEYAVAVDVYEQWLHVQEYAPPATVDAGKAERRLEQVRVVLSAVLEVPPERVFLKVRQRQRGVSQYEKQAAQGRFHEVHEGPCRFLVNFEDYLDTGLFLDHRLTRRLIGELARDRWFLNLFGYTGTATVYAAVGGATATTTVDLSRTYLEWAERNLLLNGVKSGQRQRLIQADCREWLADCRESFDLIFLDPPTFSNSKRMTGTFEVQRDHVALIQQAGRLLAANGILLFATNHQRFKLDRDGLADWRITDLTRQTLPKDFERNPRIHQCWRLER